MNPKVTKVEKIIVSIAGKSMELTIEDARKLAAELNLVFGLNAPNSVPYPVYIDRYPQPILQQPYSPFLPYPHWHTTCQSNSSYGDVNGTYAAGSNSVPTALLSATTTRN